MTQKGTATITTLFARFPLGLCKSICGHALLRCISCILFLALVYNVVSPVCCCLFPLSFLDPYDIQPVGSTQGFRGGKPIVDPRASPCKARGRGGKSPRSPQSQTETRNLEEKYQRPRQQLVRKRVSVHIYIYVHAKIRVYTYTSTTCSVHAVHVPYTQWPVMSCQWRERRAEGTLSGLELVRLCLNDEKE